MSGWFAGAQASQVATLLLSHQLIGFVVYRAPLLPVLFFGCLWGGIASPNMHLVLLLYLIFRLLPVFLELCSLLLLLRFVFVVSVYSFLIFVLVVCSPFLLLSGRTAGFFAGQSTAVVEMLQSSAPALLMVTMMVGNAAVAATATAANTQNSGAHVDDRLLCWPVYCCC